MPQPAVPALSIAVVGSGGRMGRAVVEAIEARQGAVLAACIGRPEASEDDQTSADALGVCDVAVDFSTAEAAAAFAGRCAERGSPALVIGATGFDAAQDALVREASRRIAIVKSGNFSLGVNLLAGLVRRAARTLGPDYDIEIFEAHHRRKRDAPSGTALMLARAAADGRDVELAAMSEQVREGMTGPRREGAIGFSVMRAGGIVGEHSVVFAAEDEIITLSHSARDRSLFARGAVEAALWLAGKPPGLYDMADVLGLD